MAARGAELPAVCAGFIPADLAFEMAGNVAENQIIGAVHDRIDKG